jgi:beta-glucanase (GH16 family)
MNQERKITIGRPAHGKKAQQKSAESQIQAILDSILVTPGGDLLSYFVKPVNLITRSHSTPRELQEYIEEAVEDNDAFNTDIFTYTKDCLEYLSQWNHERRAYNLDAAAKVAEEHGLELRHIANAPAYLLANILATEDARNQFNDTLSNEVEKLYYLVKESQQKRQEEQQKET